ncbi:calmodulin [Cladochytrium replicatum]|nr:calmodulin [Cladochytrium replicatum]
MATKFKDEQVSEFKEAFSLFDSDTDGFISYAELNTVVRSLGANITNAELAALAKAVDTDKSNNIDFAEFIEIMARANATKTDANAEVKQAFQVFDKGNKGFILASELRHVLTSLGEKLSNDEVNELIREIDVDGTGQIKFEAFSRYLLGK